jgi:dephospho-CoA kinase
MNLPRIIAICGYKRSGKDTISEYISHHHGHKHIKIAGKLKDVVKILFNFTDKQIEADEKELTDERWGITPRKAMQFIGTEMFQYKLQDLLPNIQRNFWIQSLISEHIIGNNNTIVISDMRFMHEYIELKKHNVFIIKINRKFQIESEVDIHPSETEFLDIPADLKLENDGTIESLYKSFDESIKMNNTRASDNVHVLHSGL